MLLTCPHFATVFQVDADLIPQDGRSVRCSICHFIWTASPVSLSASQTVVQSTDRGAAGSPIRPVAASLEALDRLKYLLKPCLAAVIAASLANGVIMNRGMITAYLPFLINGFDQIGLSIRPAVTQLQVARLNASYVGDTMRLSGGLRNIGMWRTHAADLRVTVRRVDGTIMQETVTRPDDDVIHPQAESGFFAAFCRGWTRGPCHGDTSCQSRRSLGRFQTRPVKALSQIWSGQKRSFENRDGFVG